MEAGVPLDYLEQLDLVYAKNYPRLGVKSIMECYPYGPEEIARIIIEIAEKEYKEYNA